VISLCMWACVGVGVRVCECICGKGVLIKLKCGCVVFFMIKIIFEF